MKLIYTQGYAQLKEELSQINGEWDESQPGKKVLRYDGGVMNWFESTGTIQFQGKPGKKESLEHLVAKILSPELDIPSSSTEGNLPEDDTDDFSISGSSDDTCIQHLEGVFEDSEIVIGIVSAVGTEAVRVTSPIKDRIEQFGYSVEEVRLSSLLDAEPIQSEGTSEYNRIRSFMLAGDKLRERSENNAILAYGAAKKIMECRSGGVKKKAYIINSLKHPDEVGLLRKIYGQGFYLFGIHADPKRRLHYLTNDKGLNAAEAIEITKIDEDEKIPHGQRTRDTYHLSDFFINLGKNDDQVKNTIQRFLEIILSHPHKNPTFDEFAMFMAFSSSVRSSDLSRQVGAVISRNKQIIATGANDTPQAGGGLYWAEVDKDTGEVSDADQGKDYKRGEDSNKYEQTEIINEIIAGVKNIDPGEGKEVPIKEIEAVLESSRIRDLTEFGRVVHAEMEALLSCGRSGISCNGSHLYCTTFPCHNCAKHIVASGIERVVYVEPYPKSKALEFHSDSVHLNTKLEGMESHEQVVFEPFTGVGARRFLDFFSMDLGAGSKLKRKNKDGSVVEWNKDNAKARVTLLPKSYIEVEERAAKIFDDMVS